MDLSYPYARKWAEGGCRATNWLWSWPTDRFEDLAEGLLATGFPIEPVEDGVMVSIYGQLLKVSVDRTYMADGPPDAYLIYVDSEVSPRYVGDSPEVVVEMIRSYPQPLETVDDARVKIGFPGRDMQEWIYVGSWQWGVHGEARDSEFIQRAAMATVNAINAKEEQ